jgi:hypothetical protein
MMQAVNLVPESALFNSLVMQERQLDNSIRRRRLELQQAAHPYEHPVQKRLRVYVYATHSHQQQAAGANSSASKAAEQKVGASSHGVLYAGPAHRLHTAEPPSWTLVLWGRLVDINDPPLEPGSAAAAAIAAVMQQQQQQQQLLAQHKHQPFTSFFKRITIQLNAEQYSAKEGSVSWDKFQHRFVSTQLQLLTCLISLCTRPVSAAVRRSGCTHHQPAVVEPQHWRNVPTMTCSSLMTAASTRDMLSKFISKAQRLTAACLVLKQGKPQGSRGGEEAGQQQCGRAVDAGAGCVATLVQIAERAGTSEPCGNCLLFKCNPAACDSPG